jgi:hypothetical protein
MPKLHVHPMTKCQDCARYHSAPPMPPKMAQCYKGIHVGFIPIDFKNTTSRKCAWFYRNTRKEAVHDA